MEICLRLVVVGRTRPETTAQGPKDARQEMKFVSLHHHSTFSYMDGFGTPAQHVMRAAELGMESLALTEHGNVSSHPQLEKAAKKVGIKPIFGLEAYTALDEKE